MGSWKRSPRRGSSFSSETYQARARGYGPGRFSFKVKGGRSEACQGDGALRVEMHFLPDIFVDCDVCAGRRYNRETLEVTYRGKSIADLLEMSASSTLKVAGRNAPTAALVGWPLQDRDALPRFIGEFVASSAPLLIRLLLRVAIRL